MDEVWANRPVVYKLRPYWLEEWGPIKKSAELPKTLSLDIDGERV